ncbi:MAG: PAC2 family protein [Sedimentisphaerales bacterium]|nr:PAC2 family protein [Sedimentisphaerales bacterium]
MTPQSLQIVARPPLVNPRMVLGFSGWMDGADISTGSLGYLIEQTDARRLAQIAPDEFYIYNFPGSMEFSALFRPSVDLEDGLIRNLAEPTNIFFYDADNQLILFVGKEPNLNWHSYADCILGLAEQFACREIYFLGSFAGLVPHTREPRFSGSVSDETLKLALARYNIGLAQYSGPAGISTYLTRAAGTRGLHMLNLVAEIPAYVQGRNPRCIEAMLKRLAALLDIHVNLDDLRRQGDALEKKLDKVIEDRPELLEHIKKLEENYDKEVFDENLGDLKEWLQGQGIRLD